MLQDKRMHKQEAEEQLNPLLPGYSFNIYLVAGTTPIIENGPLDFFIDRKGSFESFTWVDPWSGTTKTVRFAEDNLDIETEFKLNGIFTVRFEEVL